MSSLPADGDKDAKKPIPRGLLGRKGTPLASGARLPSIKGPRDLTLGGVKKKTFAPNIPARREKSKDASSSESKDKVDQNRSKKSVRGNKADRGRGRGRGKNKPELIQTQGSVFGEGPADRMIKRGSWGSGSCEGADSIPKPKLTFKTESHKICKEEDDLKLKELLRDDFVDDPDNNSDENCPIELPLMKSLNMKDEKKIKTSIKLENGGKILLKEATNTSNDIADQNLLNLLSGTNESESDPFLFFKLPDSLPGFVPTNDTSKKPNLPKENSSNTPSTSAGQAASIKDENSGDESCSLSHLPEGYLGKLQITKSGKIWLKLGNVCLNVEAGTQVGFLQDIVSINVPENGSSGDMTLLGKVQQRAICIPELDSLIS